MLRPLSTYLLLIMTCSFFLMGLNGLHLDNFVKTQRAETIKASTGSEISNCSSIDVKGHTLPLTETSLLENFEMENEVEVETDLLPTIECTPNFFNLNNFQCLFLNVYSTYSFTSIKIEFLDIFSPPPNC